MNSLQTYLNNLVFDVYPYVCLAVFLMGSLARFDRDQYTWKSDSSQMLRAGTLRWGSNLFHVGILFLFFGHLFGQLTPHWMYEPFISAPQKQLLAVVAGGVAGVDLLRRPDAAAAPAHLRPAHPADQPPHGPRDPRDPVGAAVPRPHHAAAVVGASSRRRHHAGPGQLPAGHRDAAARRQRAGGVAWPFKVHMLLGMTIFLLFPFSRLVHVWSGFASLAYLFRPYQVVRSRRLNVPAGRNLPSQPGAGRLRSHRP